MLILGASARAAAWSAVRAGLSPSAADLFADRDLAAVAACVRVAPGAYPDGLAAAAGTLPPGPWIYTGALENRPGLIERVARGRPLWGNDAPTVRAVRDPLAVATALRAVGLASPGVRIDPTGLPRDGSWLRKPLDSAGGCGVERLESVRPAEGPSFYYQSYVEGPSLSAVFLGTRDEAFLAGVTRQIIGRPGAPFAYRGNVAPWPVTTETERQIGAIGTALAARFRLVGLFGVDLIVADGGEPVVVEVNPRYTASVEVIELSQGRSLLAAHRDACEGRPLDGPGLWPSKTSVAKEILFAESAFAFDAEETGCDIYRPFVVPRVADVPYPGADFGPGDPVLTVFGEGETPDDALSRVGRERDDWRARLGWP